MERIGIVSAILQRFSVQRDTKGMIIRILAGVFFTESHGGFEKGRVWHVVRIS